MRHTPHFVGLIALATGWLALAGTAAAICPVGQPGCCAIDKDCDDENACNGAESCDLQSGTCLSGPPLSCDDADPCTANTCEPSSGCAFPAVPSGTPCPDGMFCNGADVCLSGTCHHAGDPCAGGDACDDLCNELTDTCFALADTACATDNNPCTLDQCDLTGACTHPPDPNATTCSDGNLCTTNDQCVTGTCVGEAITCAATDACHLAGTCNPATGACSTPVAPDNTPCADGSFCNGTDLCAAGTCVHSGDPCSGGPACQDVCDENADACRAPPESNCRSDGNPCTADVCDGLGACTHPPTTDACDDGNACTDGDTCSLAGCAGTPRACDPPDACHASNACDPQTGLCGGPALPDDTSCDDATFCNGADACLAGQCVHAGDPCAGQPQCLNQCNESTDSCLAAAGTPCDDQDACTRDDLCTASTCRGIPKTCPASDDCHDDGACDADTGQCVLPPKPDGTSCGSDGLLCTIDACTAGDCRHTPDDTRCDDATCSQGACQPGPNADTRGCIAVPTGEGEPCTDDGVACTDDRCQQGTCAHLPTDARCDDINECGNTVCRPDSGDARGCGSALDLEEGAPCSEDADACSNDLCTGRRCLHLAVDPYATCHPVQSAWDHSRSLARNTRALQAGMPAADPRVAELASELDQIGRALDSAGSILAGRAPASPPSSALETNGQQRARTALAQFSTTPKALTRLLKLTAMPSLRAALSPDALTLLKRNVRELRRGIRQLIAELRRLRKFSKSIAR